MTKTDKFRRFTFMRNYFFDTHDKDKKLAAKMTENEWKNDVISTVKKSNHNKVWLIFHDKDKVHNNKTDLDELKVLHCHGIVIDKTTRSREQTAVSLGITPDSVGENLSPVRADSSAARYLTHTSSKAMADKKYRYSVDELMLFIDGKEVTDREKVRQEYTKEIAKKERTTEDDINDLLPKLKDSVLNGKLTPRQAKNDLQERFHSAGSDAYLKNFMAFKHAVESYRQDLHEDMLENGKSMTTVFLFGAGRIGKTSLTEALTHYICKQKDWSIANDIYKSAGTAKSAKDFDIVSGYKEEPIAIFDEIAPQSYGFERFVSLFDPFHISYLDSRYQSRNFFATHSFITKACDSIEAYFRPIYNVQYASGKADLYDLKLQVLGRIQYAIEVKDDKIILYKNGEDKLFENPEKTEFKYGKDVMLDSKKMTNLCAKLYNELYTK